MLDDKQLSLLRDMLDSARSIRTYLTGVSHQAFMANPEKQDAVLRRMEIIGEAAGRLSSQTQAAFPHLPFRSMKSMRNVIIHNYGEVDIEQVWKTVSVDLDELIIALTQYLE